MCVWVGNETDEASSCPKLDMYVYVAFRFPAHTHNLVLYLAHEHTRGLEGQPPVQYEHEVVTGDGVVDTLLQATR